MEAHRRRNLRKQKERDSVRTTTATRRVTSARGDVTHSVLLSLSYHAPQVTSDPRTAFDPVAPPVLVHVDDATTVLLLRPRHYLRDSV